MRLVLYAVAGSLLALCLAGTASAQEKPGKKPATVEIDLSKLPPELAQRVQNELAKGKAPDKGKAAAAPTKGAAPAKGKAAVAPTKGAAPAKGAPAKGKA